MNKDFLFFILILFLFSFCKKNKEENIAPDSNLLNPACFKSPLKVSLDTVDLIAANEIITASFPDTVSYTLNLIGTISGANKTFSGVSDTLSVSWDGKSENNKAFVTELVKVQLTTPCQVYYKTFIISGIEVQQCGAIKSPLNIITVQDLNTGPCIITASFTKSISYSIELVGNISGAVKSYSGVSDTVAISWQGQCDNARFFQAENILVTLTIPCNNPVTNTFTITQPYNFGSNSSGNLLVSDFEGNGFVPDSTNITPPGYNSMGWSSFYSSPNMLTKFAIVSSPITAPEGSHYLTIQGYAGPNSWFAGGAYSTTIPSMPDTDPNNVYINLFINSGNNKTTLLTLALIAGGTIYKYNIMEDWVGWKLVSIKLSDLKSSSNLSITDASLATSIEFDLSCLTQTGESVESDIDYIIFTKGKPLFQ